MDIYVLGLIAVAGLGIWLAIDYYITIRRDKNPRNESNQIRRDKNPRNESNQKNNYPVLKTISGIYNILAILVILASIITFIFYLLRSIDDYSREIGVFGMIGSILYGVIGYITFKCISEGIILFTDIANDVRELKDKHLGKI